MLQTEFRPETLAAAQTVKAYCEQLGVEPQHFAVAWVLNNKLISSVVAGPRTEAQWDDYIKALDYRFTAEDEALIDRLVVSGHPSTPGFNDPAYPIEGRRARTAGQP
jgi:aryl-alcohol dehydrogenase (NADP+)